MFNKKLAKNLLLCYNILVDIFRKRELTKGSIFKGLVGLAIPIMLSNLMQTIYNLVDAFWLGKLGKAQFSAPTISLNIVFFIVAFASGLAIGGMTLVSQYTGAKMKDKVNRVAGQTLILLLCIAIILMTLGLLISKPLLRLLHTPSDAFSYTLSYLRIMFMGTPFVFGFFVYQGILQGYGDSVSPMKWMAFSVTLNIILDPILIFGLSPFPALGVRGAAYATIFSRGIASIIGLYELTSGKRGIKIGLNDIKLDKEIVSKLFRIGMPVSLGQAGTSLGFMLIMGIVNLFGSVTVSAFGVGNRIITMFMTIAMGLSQANSAMVGQNLGADKLSRAERSVWEGAIIIGIFLLVGNTLTFFFGSSVVKFFINDPEVILIGRLFFRIVSYSVVFFGIMNIFMGAFQGSGHTLPVMVLNMSRVWLLRLPLAYILAVRLNYGPIGIWWAMFISNFVTAIATFFWFSLGGWKEKVISKRELGITYISDPK